jgi:hypothetical protein
MNINLSDRELRQKFLQCNYSILASCFCHFYQEQGEGLLLIICEEDNSIQIDYETDLSKLFNDKTLKQKINPKLKSYNREQEILVGFQLKYQGTTNIEKCILHSIGSSNFPVKLAAKVANNFFSQLTSESMLCAA